MLMLTAVLIAVAIMPTATRSTQHSQDAITTMEYARHLLESTMSLDFNHQTSVPAGAGFYDVDTVFASAPAGVYTYRIDVSNMIDPVSGVANSWVHCIQVTVNWNDVNANGTTGTHTAELVGCSAQTQ